jgi:hypothetical protein
VLKIFVVFSFIVFKSVSLFGNSQMEMDGTIWLEPTSGSIDGSQINITYERIGFYDTTEMYEDGFQTDDGEFAIKMFNYGSGWGFFDITPKPTSYEIVENNGSQFEYGGNNWVIYSQDAKHATIIAKWDSIPESLSYSCDDYCLASKVEENIGICSPITTYAQNPKSKTWYPFHTPCDVPNDWNTSSTQPVNFDSELIGIPKDVLIDFNTTAVFSAGFQAGFESLDIEWSAEKVENLSNGWFFKGTGKEITNLKIFDSVKIVWIFEDGVWKAWSSVSSLKSAIEVDSEIELLNTIPKDSGFWILK